MAHSQQASPSLSSVLVYIVCLLVGGTAFFFAGLTTGLHGEGFPAVIATCLRFSVACIFFGAIWAFYSRKPMRLRDFFWMVFAGAISAAGHTLAYQSNMVIGSGPVTVMFASCAVGASLISAATGIEALNLRKIVGSTVCFCGVLIVFGQDLLHAGGNSAAAWKLVLATAIFSSTSVILKRTKCDICAQATVWYASAAICLWITIWVTGAKVPPAVPLTAVFGLLWIVAVVSIAGFGAYLYVMRRFALSTVMVQACINPFIALAVHAMVGGALLSIKVWLGSVVVIAGVALIIFQSQAKEPQAIEAVPELTEDSCVPGRVLTGET